MSWKSLGYSFLTLVVTIGLLFGTTFLFMINPVLGIIGIVILIVLPQVMMSKAIDKATGIIDKVIAKFILPIAILIIGSMSVLMILNIIPNPFYEL